MPNPEGINQYTTGMGSMISGAKTRATWGRQTFELHQHGALAPHTHMIGGHRGGAYPSGSRLNDVTAHDHPTIKSEDTVVEVTKWEDSSGNDDHGRGFEAGSGHGHSGHAFVHGARSSPDKMTKDLQRHLTLKHGIAPLDKSPDNRDIADALRDQHESHHLGVPVYDGRASTQKGDVIVEITRSNPEGINQYSGGRGGESDVHTKIGRYLVRHLNDFHGLTAGIHTGAHSGNVRLHEEAHHAGKSGSIVTHNHVYGKL